MTTMIAAFARALLQAGGLEVVDGRRRSWRRVR
jgi:hypothetical protein